MDYIFICITYLRFYAGCKAQGLDRRSLPYYGYFQPYCAWVGLIWMTLICLTYGYSSFRNTFQGTTFVYYYILEFIIPVLFVGWKLIHKTKFVKAHEMDLVWERPTVDA